MDWTGYPRALDADALVADVADLAAFLADPPEQALTVQVLDLIGAAHTAGPQHSAQVALAYPREVQAYSTWAAYTPTPTAAELLGALQVIPDAPAETPVELVPVDLQRLQCSASGSSVAVAITYRLGPSHSWRTQNFRAPAPAVDVDPRLLSDLTGARLSVRLTVDEGEGE